MALPSHLPAAAAAALLLPVSAPGSPHSCSIAVRLHLKTAALLTRCLPVARDASLLEIHGWVESCKVYKETLAVENSCGRHHHSADSILHYRRVSPLAHRSFERPANSRARRFRVRQRSWITIRFLKPLGWLGREYPRDHERAGLRRQGRGALPRGPVRTPLAFLAAVPQWCICHGVCSIDFLVAVARTGWNTSRWTWARTLM